MRPFYLPDGEALNYLHLIRYAITRTFNNVVWHNICGHENETKKR